MKKILQTLLLTLALINPEFKLHQNLLLTLNILIIIINEFFRLKKFYNNQQLEMVIEIVMNISIWTQYALDCTIYQIGAVVIIKSDMALTMKIIMSLSICINSLLNEPYLPFYYIIPYYFLLLALEFFKASAKQETEPASRQFEQIEVVSRKNSQEFHDEGKGMDEEKKSISLQQPKAEENMDLNSNQILADVNSSNQDDILSEMAWIHNQSILVFNEKNEITYQNFFLGRLFKKSSKSINQDYENMFLESVVEIASREVNEMFGCGEESDFQSESFILNGTAHSRYKINGAHKIKEIISQLFEGFSKWKFFTFTLYKLKSAELDYSGLFVKSLVTKIKDQLYALFIFEVYYQPSTKKLLDEPLQFQNVFSAFLSESNNYINSIHMFLLLCLHEVEKGGARVPKDYLKQMRMSTLKFMTFLASIKDLSLQLSNQLIINLKNNHFKIQDIIDELLMIYEDSLKIKEISLIPIVDNDLQVHNDQERTKQIIKCLFDVALKYTVNDTIKLDVRTNGPIGVIVSMRDIPIRDDQVKYSVQLVLKTTTQLMRSNCRDFDLSAQLELQIATMLAYQLSGQFRRGLEVTFDPHNVATFQFYIESQPNNSRQVLQRKRAFETSLSMLLAQAQDSSQYKNDDSKFLSMTQFSKQYSIKQGEALIDLQSAHFSQISKVKPESPNIRAQTNSGPQNQSNSGIFRIQGQDSLLQPNYGTRGGAKSDSMANDSSKPPSSALDFGDTSNPNLDPPELSCKFLSSVIKFKLTNQCCSKVLIADNDFFTVQILQILLDKYEVKADRCFTGQQAIQKIKYKCENPCRCKNNSYLLFFVDVNLPVLCIKVIKEIIGVELIKEIKSMFKIGKIDKAYLIAMASFCDMDVKYECYKQGTDYFLSKPFDLFELSAIVQYLQSC